MLDSVFTYGIGLLILPVDNKWWVYSALFLPASVYRAVEALRDGEGIWVGVFVIGAFACVSGLGGGL